MDLRPVISLQPAASAAASLALNPVRAVPAAAEAGPADGPTLGPAVSVSIGSEGGAAPPEAERRGYTRDADSRALVFQVVDPRSGEVVMQIPDEVVLKARVYADAAAARAQQAERPLNRTA